MTSEQLERVIELLQRLLEAAERGRPLWPQTQPIEWEEARACPKCGIALKGLSHYVCNNSGCPVFVQVTLTASAADRLVVR